MPEHQENPPMERPENPLLALTFGDTRGPVEPMADINYSFDQMELTRRVMALTADVDRLQKLVQAQHEVSKSLMASIDAVGDVVKLLARGRAA